MLHTIQTQLREHQYTWLVTGAAGFIGSHLCQTLLKANQIVIGLDNLSSGHEKNIQAITSSLTSRQLDNWEFLNGDIRDESTCIEACDGVDYILHHAAVASVPLSFQDPVYTNSVNVGGFLHILSAAKTKNVKRVIYASSSAVYGDSTDQYKVEEQTGELLSPYATDKLTNELYAKTFGRCYGLETIGLRYFNIFGPRQDPNGPYAAVIPVWINYALRNEPCIIYGDGKQTRDFCYIDNVVSANLTAALCKNQSALFQAYNVASDNSISLIELQNAMEQELGHALEIQHKATRVGDIKHSAASIEKIKELLNFIPQTSFYEGLKETIQWFKQTSVANESAHSS